MTTHYDATYINPRYWECSTEKKQATLDELARRLTNNEGLDIRIIQGRIGESYVDV